MKVRGSGQAPLNSAPEKSNPGFCADSRRKAAHIATAIQLGSGRPAPARRTSSENRSSIICLVEYKDGEKRYIIAPQGLKPGMTINSGKNAIPEVGHAMYLSDIPLGTIVHNIELHPGRGANIARSAGSYAQLAARDGKYAVLKLPSGETRQILVTCLAVIGAVGNSEHNLQVSGKAGRSRWLGRRPRVRGVVMNPVDHPMGGGEGRSSGGHPRSRNGIPAKGYKTRNKRKASTKNIIERRKK